MSLQTKLAELHLIGWDSHERAWLSVAHGMAEQLRAGMTRRDAAAIIFRSSAHPDWETALAFVDIVHAELAPDATPADAFVIAAPVNVLEQAKAALTALRRSAK